MAQEVRFSIAYPADYFYFYMRSHCSLCLFNFSKLSLSSLTADLFRRHGRFPSAIIRVAISPLLSKFKNKFPVQGGRVFPRSPNWISTVITRLISVRPTVALWIFGIGECESPRKLKGGRSTNSRFRIARSI